MKPKKNLRDTYIQLVETFITALESGKSGSELEDIRSEIRNVSSQLGVTFSVENTTQHERFSPGDMINKLSNERDTKMT
jgi:hypothetical protein